jgi:hypothetical protein
LQVNCTIDVTVVKYVDPEEARLLAMLVADPKGSRGTVGM